MYKIQIVVLRQKMQLFLSHTIGNDTSVVLCYVSYNLKNMIGNFHKYITIVVFSVAGDLC